MSIRTAFWERRKEHGYVDEMSEQGYLAAVTGFTVYGMVVAAVLAFMTMAWQPGLIEVLLLGLLLPIAGIFMAFYSSNWFISFIGYNMVVVGIGLITGPSVARYQTGVVMTALLATGGVTVVMSGVGLAFPGIIRNWGGYLMAGLLALVFVRIAQAIMAGMGVSESVWYIPWVEYLAAVLFSLYIVYDWGQALERQFTLDNAVDSAVSLFLDIINLFFTMLRIFGGSGSSKD